MITFSKNCEIICIPHTIKTCVHKETPVNSAICSLRSFGTSHQTPVGEFLKSLSGEYAYLMQMVLFWACKYFSAGVRNHH